MLVRVSRNDDRPAAEVLEVDDLGRLSVRLDGVDVAAAGQALQEQGLVEVAASGEIDGAHAWLVIDRLRRSGPDDPDWQARFAAMVEYAATKGWLDPTATCVRAHVEPGDAAFG